MTSIKDGQENTYRKKNTMPKLTKLSKVNDSFSVNRYDNGWMVEISGKNEDGDWKTTKMLCHTEADLLDIIVEYNSMELDS